jgi:hypothetical protein
VHCSGMLRKRALVEGGCLQIRYRICMHWTSLLNACASQSVHFSTQISVTKHENHKAECYPNPATPCPPLVRQSSRRGRPRTKLSHQTQLKPFPKHAPSLCRCFALQLQPSGLVLSTRLVNGEVAAQDWERSTVQSHTQTDVAGALTSHTQRSSIELTVHIRSTPLNRVGEPRHLHGAARNGSCQVL